MSVKSNTVRLFFLVLIIQGCITNNKTISHKSLQGEWLLIKSKDKQEDLRVVILSDSLVWHNEDGSTHRVGYELVHDQINYCYEQMYIGIMCDSIPILSLIGDTLKIQLKENGKLFNRAFVKKN